MSINQNLRNEQQIQDDIFAAIDRFESFCFNAGAGAGKTHALVEAIKHILINKHNILKKHKQGLLCITYTNVAANELKQRLGNSQFLTISTIHDVLWDIIKRYNDELLLLHKEKIDSELADLDNKINGFKDEKNFIKLAPKMETFKKIVLENRQLFWDNETANSKEFKEVFAQLIDQYDFLSDALKNVAKFKNLFQAIDKQRRLMETLKKLKLNNSKFEVKYDGKSNFDQLDKFLIGHDTLIEYSEQLIIKYPTLQRILTDQFPYIFVDEYQDTNEKVVNLLATLDKSTIEESAKNKNFLLGYFGDNKQKIYDNGIGGKLTKIHPNLKIINKIYNRRSPKIIIDIINKIRNDEIKQQPIDPSNTEGAVEFYYCTEHERNKQENIANFIQFIKQNLQASAPNIASIRQQISEPKIDCLVLINRLLAELECFNEVYSLISDSGLIYFQELNTKILSRQIDKLHPALVIIYNVLSLYKKLKDKKTTYYDLIGQTDVTVKQAQGAVKNLMAFTGEKLRNFIQHIASYTNGDEVTQCILRNFFGASNITNESFGAFEKFIENSIYTKWKPFSKTKNSNDMNNKITAKQQNEEDKKAIELTKNLLDLDLRIWLNWFDFIEDKGKEKNIRYHTYHGTKGEQYDNVVIIMEHHFGTKNRNKFLDYFKSLSSDNTQGNDKLLDEVALSKLENTQNLIYVACSRARKNLYILYLDDIGEIKENITHLFAPPQIWKSTIE
ncbi:UvrD-helicase domain-containing protein [Bartonella sp. HY038]|uniref:UvrD-helicase domain-containing protein n=1 Tax=Bartonella sp. HY038 TaxID=2759660 RepID=UPI0015F8B608|nr:UvrD-helicase domain-containing protein [Bartonella sp. HY038]